MTEAESCCEMEGCCHNESQAFQVENNFAISSFQFDFDQVFVLVPVVLSTVAFDLPVSIANHLFYDRPSPPGVKLLLASLQTFVL
ncbi:MAG TPA: hypothetical protein VMW76_04575 [Bacteroidales bacterium]|nr:hypothetical protein [Bacteroidales bacterium]